MNIVFLSCTVSYPYEIAAVNTKINSVAKGLIEQGHSVTIVGDPRGYSSINNTERSETIEHIPYVLYPSKGHLSYLRNTWAAVQELKNNKTEDKNIMVLCENGNFFGSLFVAIAGKILGYHVSTIYHEWRLAFIHKVAAWKKWSFYLSDYLFGYWSDSILPISHFLMNKAKKFNKPQIILPILYEYKEAKQSEYNYNYFLYCASAAYEDAVCFILESFQKYLNLGGQRKLTLVMSGTEKQLERVSSLCEEKAISGKVCIKSRLSSEELSNQFCGAQALLIPLDPNNLQDVARFSQKISEYLASSRPIITTPVGEIPYYFKDKQNAIIPNYSPEDYANAMLWADNNENIATEIGKEGYKLGCREFNYGVICGRLAKFYETNY